MTSTAKQTKSFFYNVSLVLLVLVLILLVFGIVREYLKQQELDNELVALEVELERLNLDKKDFLESIEAYQSDFFVEQEARAKFNLKKPGEKVAVIPVTTLEQIEARAEAEKAATDVASESSLYLQNVKGWWQYFFGATS
jgi:cell division protein FtsB